ncbi:NapC/NirT family cytochrome c [uncultured Desulfovibrio sp.]|uniref:cytochrome c3 family protein n=1 Tax=uncultured Desulfovibrio sp. TaxID=167968 RepID=UPI002609AFD8|nr:NapC/NirT family cytochrome c [uncultured Desulfovibrio sp.]
MRHRKKLAVLAVGAVIGITAVSATVQYTSGTEFCLSCHEMRVYAEEMKASTHAKDAEGRPIGCAQCHIPGSNIVRMLAAKMWMGTKDIWVHAVEGGHGLDRAAMQPRARRFIDDANCLACHQDLGRNAKGDGPVSEEGRLAHDSYLGKNGRSRNGCAGCHANLAHLPPFDARIPKNHEFAAKLKEADRAKP